MDNPDTSEEYDHWYRLGIFDKCNGREELFDRSHIDENLNVGAYFDGFDSCEVKIQQELEIEVELEEVKVLHFVSTERVGEVEGMFDDSGELLGLWSNNDANWRHEYFSPFMRKLGFRIETHWQDEWEEKLIEAAKEYWGLSDFDVDPPY